MAPGIFLISLAWVNILTSIIYLAMFFFVRRRAGRATGGMTVSGASVPGGMSKSTWDFLWFDFWFAMFFGILGIGSAIFQTVPSGLTYVYIFSHIFLFIGLAYLVRMVFRLAWSRLFKQAFVSMLTFGAIVTLVSIILPNQNPYLELGQMIGHIQVGVINWNINPITGDLYSLIPVIFLIGILKLGYETFKLKESAMIKRSILLIVGIIVINVFGPLHDLAHSTFLFLLAEAGTFIGQILILLSVLYRPSNQTRRPSQQPADNLARQQEAQ